MDAIDVLEADHKQVEQLFKKFEKAGDRAYKTKRDLVDEIIRELVVHAEIEEQIFYPRIRKAVPETKDEILEDLEEHHVMELLLAELVRMDAEDERFDAKVAVLIEIVRHHVAEEEEDLFPKVRKRLSADYLEEMAEELKAAKDTVPTKPHPRSPDTPPGNLAAGAVSAVTDRVRDRLRSD
jgi:hemerythrin superfamily protein